MLLKILSEEYSKNTWVPITATPTVLYSKRMHLTCTERVEFLNTRDNGWGKTSGPRQKHGSVTAWPSCHCSPCVRCFVYNKSEVKFINSSNHISAKCIFNWNTSVTGHKEERIGFPSANNCQRQPQTPQSHCISDTATAKTYDVTFGNVFMYLSSQLRRVLCKYRNPFKSYGIVYWAQTFVSFFSTRFLQNIFRNDRYVAS
jgi:hypothetical protein